MVNTHAFGVALKAWTGRKYVLVQDYSTSSRCCHCKASVADVPIGCGGMFQVSGFTAQALRGTGASSGCPYAWHRTRMKLLCELHVLYGLL